MVSGEDLRDHRYRRNPNAQVAGGGGNDPSPHMTEPFTGVTRVSGALAFGNDQIKRDKSTFNTAPFPGPAVVRYSENTVHRIDFRESEVHSRWQEKKMAVLRCGIRETTERRNEVPRPRRRSVPGTRQGGKLGDSESGNKLVSTSAVDCHRRIPKPRSISPGLRHDREAPTIAILAQQHTVL